MSAATQIYYARFDEVSLKLPPPIRSRVQAEIDRIGLRLSTYPHHRLKGSTRFRTRIGDYRIIYTLMGSETRFTYSPSVTDEKSIGVT